MPRYLVLEIDEDGNEGLHDPSDLVETMRLHDNGRAYLRGAGYVLDVKIPVRFEAHLVGELDRRSEIDIYAAQGA